MVKVMCPEAYDAVATPKDGLFIGAYFRIEGSNKYEVYTASKLYGAADKKVELVTSNWNEVLDYVHKIING